jgi:molybdate transport system regulatory protein
MNRLPAHILNVDLQGSIALVDASVGGMDGIDGTDGLPDRPDLRFTALLVGVPPEVGSWNAGMPVTLLFKEAEVSLARHLSGMISLRNRITGTVISLDQGKLLTRVRLAAGRHEIESVITTRSAVALGLAIGVQAEALIKANEVTVVTSEQE